MIVINWIKKLFSKNTTEPDIFFLRTSDPIHSYGQVVTEYELKQREQQNNIAKARHAAYLGVMKEPKGRQPILCDEAYRVIYQNSLAAMQNAYPRNYGALGNIADGALGSIFR